MQRPRTPGGGGAKISLAGDNPSISRRPFGSQAPSDLNIATVRLQRGAEHLHRLGARRDHGCLPAVLDVLDTCRARLTLAKIKAAGADRFPPPLFDAVPS